MQFGSYWLWLTVENRPLPECYEENSASLPSTGPSYVLNEAEGGRLESPVAMYAVVVQPSAPFEVNFACPDASRERPVMAEVYVDGMCDHTYFSLYDRNPKRCSHFVASDGEGQHLFQFGSPQATELALKSRKPRHDASMGGVGAISVYFYRARWITPRDVTTPRYTIETAELPASMAGSNVITTFKTIKTEKRRCFTNKTRESEDPIAVLHLHYRSSGWSTRRTLHRSSPAPFPLPPPWPFPKAESWTDTDYDRALDDLAETASNLQIKITAEDAKAKTSNGKAAKVKAKLIPVSAEDDLLPEFAQLQIGGEADVDKSDSSDSSVEAQGKRSGGGGGGGGDDEQKEELKKPRKQS